MRAMLLWSADTIPKSLLKPPHAPSEVAYNTNAIKVFKVIQSFMGDRSQDKAVTGSLPIQFTAMSLIIFLFLCRAKGGCVCY